MGGADPVALASDLSAQYADLDGLRMALVTGSVARGLADGASDLDLYLYWDEVDRERLGSERRLEARGATRIVGLATMDGFFEKYRLDGRFVDVESVSVDTLERAAVALGTADAIPDGLMKLAAGLRDAVPISGSADLHRWQERLSYSDGAAAAEVAARGVRLLSPTALFELTYERGDMLSFAARLSRVLLDAVALLGAANREFVPVDDPKWMPWHLGRLRHVPPRIVERIERGLRDPSPAAMADLDDLLGEVLDIVERRIAGADIRAARFTIGLRPRQ
ncbi:MAG TPA: hypothetical protein VEK09_04545 [Jatrophihabitantaceae bacterium]|nr:hypothetical protein [Jatrophihabitantaceae bacterium]